MKNYYLITKEATKYWKKALKNDRVMIACKENTIYIVNGFNAFKMPAYVPIWDELARPAFMTECPEEGAAIEFFRGEKKPGCAQNVIDIFTKVTGDTTPAKRSPFTVDANDGLTMRLYTNANGSVSGINSVYDAMVDPSQVEEIYCGGRYSPVILKNEHFTALIMPVRMADNFSEKARETFGKLLEV